MSKKNENLTALVVDDYENIRLMLVNALKKLGVTVTEASNGIEALDILSKKQFDILFTDIVMPEMDGFELCEEVRKRSELRELPVVVVSTHCDSNYIVKALQLGADDYIAKPIEIDLVEKVISRITTELLPEAANV